MAQTTTSLTKKGKNNVKVSFDFVKTPITQIADYIIISASKSNASDIHFDPREDGMIVRFRIDGDLQDYSYIPKAYERNLTTRLKLLANMNITESRLPQDGAIKGFFGDVYLDMRVSCLPLNEGEKIVIRILDYSRSLHGIESLGFHPDNLVKLKRMMEAPNGIILVTGATGSGKSTTTYSILQGLNKPETNIITVEDPIEMNIQGINQVQVNSEIGMTFATALRSILRQDPNIILIGEIRDSETAQIAVRAAITGHLVLSTVHTNNSLSTIERLLDMDVERYLLSTALNGIISQRLAKSICPYCRFQRKTTPYEKKVFKNFMKLSVGTIWEANPTGCEHCRKGYRGRIAIQEVLELDDDIRSALNTETITKEELRKMVYTDKTITLLQDALIKCLNGDTSFEEVYRVIEMENDEGEDYHSELTAAMREISDDFDANEYVQGQGTNLGNNLRVIVDQLPDSVFTEAEENAMNGIVPDTNQQQFSTENTVENTTNIENNMVENNVVENPVPPEDNFLIDQSEEEYQTREEYQGENNYPINEEKMEQEMNELEKASISSELPKTDEVDQTQEEEEIPEDLPIEESQIESDNNSNNEEPSNNETDTEKEEEVIEQEEPKQEQEQEQAIEETNNTSIPPMEENDSNLLPNVIDNLQPTTPRVNYEDLEMPIIENIPRLGTDKEEDIVREEPISLENVTNVEQNNNQQEEMAKEEINMDNMEEEEKPYSKFAFYNPEEDMEEDISTPTSPLNQFYQPKENDFDNIPIDTQNMEDKDNFYEDDSSNINPTDTIDYSLYPEYNIEKDNYQNMEEEMDNNFYEDYSNDLEPTNNNNFNKNKEQETTMNNNDSYINIVENPNQVEDNETSSDNSSNNEIVIPKFTDN